MPWEHKDGTLISQIDQNSQIEYFQYYFKLLIQNQNWNRVCSFEKEKDFSKLGRTFYGVIGAGTIGIDRTPPPSEGVICTTTRSHSNKLVNAALEAVKPTEVLKVGGSGHKVLLLIEGKAHAYVFPSPGCKKWDTCAPEAILHALGGKVS